MRTAWDFAAAHTDARRWSVSRRLMALDSDCAAGDAIDCRSADAAVDVGSCAHDVAEIYSNPANRYLAYRHRRMRMAVKPIVNASSSTRFPS